MKVNMQYMRKPRIEMLPLIDIVFLLLVFFIYSILSMAVHRGLPVILPTSSAVKIEKNLILSITLKANGTIYVDKEKVSMENLKTLLQQKSKGEKATGVLLFADRSLSYQNLFKVLDQIWMAGLTRISLQAKADQ